jgi:hypothetical protein
MQEMGMYSHAKLYCNRTTPSPPATFQKLFENRDERRQNEACRVQPLQGAALAGCSPRTTKLCQAQ